MKKLIVRNNEIIKQIIILNKYKEKLIGLLEEKEKNDTLIILCHGFYGNKDQLLYKLLSLNLINLNYSIFRFDFSGNGESEGIFGKSGIKKESDDLKCVIKHFKNYKNIILIGHSMGGAVSLINSNYSKRIKKVILINPLVLPLISFEDSILKFTPTKLLTNLNNSKNKIIQVLNKKNKKVINKYKLYPSFFKELNINIVDYVQKLNIPILIIHSKKDEIIPLSHVNYLYNNIKTNNKKLILFDYYHIKLANSKKNSLNVIKIIINYLKKNKENFLN